MKNEINAAELSQSLAESSVVVIDLMNKETFEANHIPGAINIPIEELESRASEIPGDKPVVVVCRRGLAKSDQALKLLAQSGIGDAKKLAGGTEAWLQSFAGNG